MRVCLFFSLHLIFAVGIIFGGEYKIEGVFKNDGETRILRASHFLPFNPTIVAFSSDQNATTSKCLRWLPMASLIFKDRPFFIGNEKCDFLWIENEILECEILYAISAHLKDISVIYTTTHFSTNSCQFKSLKQYLESNNFRLFIHWYWEHEKGNALFIKKDLFEAAMRCWDYNFHKFPLRSTSYNYEIKNFLKKAENKLPISSLPSIDFIYMINLDERPEKFKESVEGLKRFGVIPYRFSAVNGWKLPHEILTKVGVKLFSEMPEKYLGTVYEEFNGHSYMSNEIIQKNGKSYFAIGMTRGAIGIVLSHLSILKDAYDSGYNTIWVMEDDVEAIEDPKQLSELVQKLDYTVKDWDILFTDTDTKDSKGNHVSCRTLPVRPNFNIAPISIFLSHFHKVSNDFSRIGMRYGAYSMIVRRSGMKKILDYFNSYGIYLPYDMDFWLVSDLKMYCVNRDIISHKAGALTDNHAPCYENKIPNENL